MKNDKLEITYIPFELSLIDIPTIINLNPSHLMDFSRYTTSIDPEYINSYILKIQII